MNTQIFKSYSEFSKREDKKINGVSEDFAKENKNYEKQNENNKSCWNCSGCSGCSDCSDCSDCSGCSDCSDCSGCSGCSDCSDCSDCSRCSRCSRCSGCSGCSRCSRCSRCSDCSDVKNAGLGFPAVPKIENIHQKILEATKSKDALDMDRWHTCETTHCRAGWVTQLAGVEGKKLEDATSTLFAAMMIYKESSTIRVSCPRFYEGNEKAMKDIERCALEESKINN